jgi:subtilisin family serine protease
MNRFAISFVVLSALALAFLIMPTSAQNPTVPTPDYPFPGYPPEFSPAVTARQKRTGRPRVPSKKFVKSDQSIPNRYVVVLNDDVVSDKDTLEVRRANVQAIADEHARAYHGKIGFIYETALKGYSIELPNEGLAIALSNRPEVKWVEDEVMYQLAQDEVEPEGLQGNPPWGLDAIDGSVPVPVPSPPFYTTTGLYLFNRTGSGVKAYIIDSGINCNHQDFGTFTRASIGADFIAPMGGDFCLVTPSNNDCSGHGTAVASVIGGDQFGVAKGVSLISVKACNLLGCPTSALVQAIDWVSADHNNFGGPAVANFSVGSSIFSPDHVAVEQAIAFSIGSGVTYVVAAGNQNDDVRLYSPAEMAEVIAVGGVDFTLNRWGTSNYGPLDIFAPGAYVLAAQSGNGSPFEPFPCPPFAGTNNEKCALFGTSMAAPHVTGTVAMYLETRPAPPGGFCQEVPKQGPGISFGSGWATCPDRVSQFIDANAMLNRLGSSINGPTSNSPNRLILNSPIPTTTNPIDNQRFFVWQHYADFISNTTEPDTSGLDWWTNEIIDHGHCAVGVNGNNDCTDVWRTLTSRAFWVAFHGDLFTSDYGLRPGKNGDFIELCYQIYLRRPSDPVGKSFWMTSLAQNYGDPANPGGVFNTIKAFLHSSAPDGYRTRFGQG